MDDISNLLNKITVNNFDVGSEHWVDITHINNPLSFYVRPTAYRRYLSVLHEYDDRPQSKELRPGSIVIYKSKLLKCCVRGRIMFIENVEEGGDASYDIFALDYGCYEKSVLLEDLYKTPHSPNIPPLAVHCQLADCKPRSETWSNEAIESMKFFIGKERAKMIIRSKSPDSIIVELYNSCPDDIATMLAYDGQTVLGYSDNVISRLTTIEPEEHFYKLKQYEVGDVLTVRKQAGDSLKGFFVAEVDDYKQYLNELPNFTYFCKQQKNLEVDGVEEGMAVGALMIMANKYERAVVTDITVPGEKVKVMLVDWGKFVEVPISRLKPMSTKFFRQPAAAILCSVEESKAWDIKLNKCLYPGCQFNITIVQLGEQYETPHIVQISQMQ